MNLYAAQQQQHFPTGFALPVAQQQELYDNVMKREPYEVNTHRQQRASFSYPAQHPYSEQELAESLGWVDYSSNQNGRTNHTSSRPPMQLTDEMSMQQSTFHPLPPPSSIPQSGNGHGPSGGSFHHVPIPRSSKSPVGWHSSFESPNFVADSVLHGPVPALGPKSGSSHEGDVANKKAMRRYSHNAGLCYSVFGAAL